MRKKMVARWLAFTVSLCVIRADASSVFAVSVKLDSRYNRGLTVCTTVRPNEPFNLTWSHEKVRSSIAGVLRKPQGKRYPLTLTVDQHFTDSETRNSITQAYELELGTWQKSTDILSSDSNEIEERSVLLVKGGCPSGIGKSPS